MFFNIIFFFHLGLDHSSFLKKMVCNVGELVKSDKFTKAMETKYETLRENIKVLNEGESYEKILEVVV